MIVAGIGSAETSGIAVVERTADGAERLIRHGVLRVDSAADVERVAAELAADRADLYAIEQPFLHGSESCCRFAPGDAVRSLAPGARTSRACHRRRADRGVAAAPVAGGSPAPPAVPTGSWQLAPS